MKENSNGRLVSIVMNCFNCEKYLREAIDSVYAQTYQDWEIIFWDNASTDSSAEIAQSYDSKLKYFCGDKLVPLYEARNFALQYCTGETVAFLDCDDVWLEQKLKLQIEYAVNKSAPVVATEFLIVDEKSRYISTVKQDSDLIDFDQLLKINPISISSIIIDRSLLERYCFNSTYQLLGDFDLWLRITLKESIHMIHEVTQLSRRHEQNTSKIYFFLWQQERQALVKSFLVLPEVSFMKRLLLRKYLYRNWLANIIKKILVV
jgi:glycosyltransferase involved in cell wall biosynthesis